jgi:hypothetical protein
MLIALLQRRLNLGDADPAVVVGKIRRHREVGPLMQQLERWMHDPHRSNDADLTALLLPMTGWTADPTERTAIGEWSDGGQEPSRDTAG